MVSEEAQRRQLLNESRVRLFGADPERVIAFVCECSDSDCRESVLLRAGDYATVAGAGELLKHDRHRPA